MISNYTNLDGEIKFEDFLRFRGYQEKSIRAHCQKMAKLPAFDRKSVMMYISQLLANHTTATANKYLNTYRLYAKYLVETKQATKSQLAWLKSFKHYKEVPRQRVVFSDKELNDFLSCDDCYNVYFELLARTGARPSELACLRVCDVNFANNTFSIQRSKTGEGRTVPIPDDLVDKLYRHSRLTASKWLFPVQSDSSRHITIDSLRKAFNKRKAKTGINPLLSPYCLRHTFITRLLSSGVDLFIVQSIVGHKQANTTQKYMHLNLSMQRQALKQDPFVWRSLPPREKLKMVSSFIVQLGLDLDDAFCFTFSSRSLSLRLV